ncbi:MAG: hypothetical protein AB1716_19470 [Planctomycetota bacterium]
MLKPLIHTAAVVITLGTITAAADPPLTYDLEYAIHEVAEDANSPVVWTVGLELTREQTDGHWIGWAVDKVVLTELEDGVPADVWHETDPAVYTADGLWWIQHANVETPQLTEFTLPPRIAGTAPADEQSPSLLYDFEGVPYVPTPTPPYEVTTGLTYSFALDDDPPQKKKEAEEEPVETERREM